MPNFVDSSKLINVRDFILALNVMQPGQAMIFWPLPKDVKHTDFEVDTIFLEVERLAAKGLVMVFQRKSIGRHEYRLEAHACSSKAKDIIESIADAAYTFAKEHKRLPQLHELKLRA